MTPFLDSIGFLLIPIWNLWEIPIYEQGGSPSPSFFFFRMINLHYLPKSLFIYSQEIPSQILFIHEKIQTFLSKCLFFHCNTLLQYYWVLNRLEWKYKQSTHKRGEKSSKYIAGVKVTKARNKLDSGTHQMLLYVVKTTG